jgi:hypothetical protein
VNQIPHRLVNLIAEVLAKYHPEWVPAFRASGIETFNDEQRFAIRQSCTDELCASGLSADDEPNERGIQLEEIIDVLGRA